jgi:transcriptional antiterminator RfaH
MTLRWYAAQTNPLCERRAEAGLREHGFTVFLPVETKWKRSRSKARERVNTPLFTGYIFVGVGPWQSLYQVRQIDGIRGLVCGHDGEPIDMTWMPVQLPSGRFLRNPDGRLAKVSFVYDLQARQAGGEFDHTPARRSLFRKGDKARIMLDGPLKDQIAEVLEANDEGRVKLLLSAKFGWRTTLDSDHLEHPEELLKAA